MHYKMRGAPGWHDVLVATCRTRAVCATRPARANSSRVGGISASARRGPCMVPILQRMLREASRAMAH